MKRMLLENVQVAPYTSGDAIDREGFISAILGIQLGAPTGTPTGIAVKVVLTECDTETGSYTPATDKLVPLDKALDETGAFSVDTDAAGGELLNIDLDLVGCKQFIKAKVEVVCTGGTTPSCSATAALVLGDAAEMPV